MEKKDEQNWFRLSFYFLCLEVGYMAIFTSIYYPQETIIEKNLWSSAYINSIEGANGTKIE